MAFPTETFYGLGAAALNAHAVGRIFQVKRRPDAKPLLVLVDSIRMAESVAYVPEAARPLMIRHWPGPLTLVMKSRADLPAGLTAGTGTIGVRMSGHPVASGLVHALGEPVTAPSANRSGSPPCVTADAVLAELGGDIDLLIDACPAAGGLPSTVLDLTVTPARVIRPGAVMP